MTPPVSDMDSKSVRACRMDVTALGVPLIPRQGSCLWSRSDLGLLPSGPAYRGTHPHEARGHHVEEEPAQELDAVEGHDLGRAALPVPVDVRRASGDPPGGAGACRRPERVARAEHAGKLAPSGR